VEGLAGVFRGGWGGVLVGLVVLGGKGGGGGGGGGGAAAPPPPPPRGGGGCRRVDERSIRPVRFGRMEFKIAA